MNKFTTLILTAALSTLTHVALAASYNPTPATQAAGMENKRTTVRFADLDLARPEGAAMLYQRLHAAATAVCSSLESRELARLAIFRQCVAETMEGTVAQINRPGLSAFYRAKVGGENAVRFEVASSNGVAH